MGVTRRFGLVLLVLFLLCPVHQSVARQGECDGVWLRGLEQRGFDGDVKVVRSLPNDEVLFVGEFSRHDGQILNSVARWNGKDFESLSGGVTGRWSRLEDAVVASNGDVYVVGTFAAAGGVPALNIARWSNGTWHSMDEGLPAYGMFVGIGLNGKVAAISADWDIPYRPKYFLSVWEDSSWTHREVTLTGHPWWEFPFFRGLAIRSNGNIVAYGAFLSIDGVETLGVASWNGTAWEAMDAGLDWDRDTWTMPRGGACAFAELADGRVLLGGGFQTAPPTEFGTALVEWHDGRWRAITDSPMQFVTAIRSSRLGGMLLAGRDKWSGSLSISRWADQATRTVPERPWDVPPSNPIMTSIVERANGEVVANLRPYGNNSIQWARVRFDASPVITLQPKSLDVPCRGFDSHYLLRVEVLEEMQQGATYQWRRDGVPVGYSWPDLDIDDWNGFDCGIYDCVITTPCGQTLSEPASVHIACKTADWNRDGIIDSQDWGMYLDQFETGVHFYWPSEILFADFNKDGFLDFNDFDEFVRLYEHGC